LKTDKAVSKTGDQDHAIVTQDMAIGIMLTEPVNTFTIAAAWVRSSFQTFVKYVIITHMAYHASKSAHNRTAMEEAAEES
jgi:hypothetical protein